MDSSFWHQRWEKNEIGFHEGKPNPFLVKHFHELSVAKGRRIFVPLCGKTQDISWLLSRGYRVAGAELSQLAIEQLFIELGMQPEIATVGSVGSGARTISIYSSAISLPCLQRCSGRSMPLMTGPHWWRFPKRRHAKPIYSTPQGDDRQGTAVIDFL